MSLPRIEVRIGRTINNGNFESTRVDVGMEMDVEKGKKPGDVYKKVLKFVHDKLAELVEALDD